MKLTIQGTDATYILYHLTWQGLEQSDFRKILSPLVRHHAYPPRTESHCPSADHVPACVLDVLVKGHAHIYLH